MSTPAIPELDSSDLARYDTDAWVDYHRIKNEKGEPIEWLRHQFLIDIYNDQSDNLVVMKPAQVGLSTLEVLKNVRDAEMRRMDIIYTLPSDADVSVFVGGKVNRIIANNPHLVELVRDKDSIDQKQIGNSMLYFRGTWTKKSAIMVTADRLVHDEKDSSKQEVIADYQARLQHSKFSQTHVFSHPSVPNSGVDVEWQLSDRKEWFVTCPHCLHEQILTWNMEDERKMSVDVRRRVFVCKKCRLELDWHARAEGTWRARKDRAGAKWSGYHISLLMAPWITAGVIVDKYGECVAGKQTLDYFYNKILGLPYSGGGNSVQENMIKDAVMPPDSRAYSGRIVVGVDTGVKLRYVYGTRGCLLGYGQVEDYMPDDVNKLPLNRTLEYFLKTFPDSVMVIDQGGDIIGPRKLRAKYPGRVFLCHYARDHKTLSLVKWGEKDESGNVVVDRNNAIQLLVDYWRDRRIGIYRGAREDWHEYWLHWSHIYRVQEEDTLGVMRYRWLRSDRDDWVHATVYWWVGADRFGGRGGIVGVGPAPDPNSYLINPDMTAGIDPDAMFGGKKAGDEEPWWYEEEEPDWRAA